MAALPRLVNAFCPNFVDVENGQANAFWTTLDQSDSGGGSFAGLIAATQALSAAGLFAAVFQTRTIPGATPVTGPYDTVLDQVVFTVQSVNATMQLAVPAPKNNIFLSDNLTVDLTNTLVTAWWAEVQGILGDSYGSPWTTLVGGYRRMINITPGG
jgi:hypothetical protein